MTSINETVTDALQSAGLGSYASRATPVVNALIEREQRLYTGIVDAARDADLNPDLVTNLLSGLGMAAPSAQQPGQMYAVPVDEVDDEEEDVDVRVDNLQQRINSLEAFARANGYSG
jgi:hypothetical protein